MKPLTYSQSTILEAVTKAAEKRLPCPKNVVLAAQAGLRAESSAQCALKRLEDLGYLTINATPGWRVITLPDGKRTATRKECTRKDNAGPALRIVARAETAKSPVPTSPPVFRDPCPCCGVRLDADPALCCPRGRAIRSMVA